MEYQTTLGSASNVVRGSGKLELSGYQAVPDYIDAGPLSGLEFDEGLEMGKEENDNAEADEFVAKQEPSIKCNLHAAMNSEILDILRGGFDVKSTTGAGSAAQSETIPANSTEAGKFVVFGKQNHDKTAPTSVSITCNSVSLTEDTDYVIGRNAAGEYGVSFIDTVAYDPTKAIVIGYTVNPIASVTYQSGSKTQLPYLTCRITTKNGGSRYRLTGYKGRMKVGLKWQYPKDTDTDKRLKIPLEISLFPDDTYHLDTETNNGMIYALEHQRA